MDSDLQTKFNEFNILLLSITEKATYKQKKFAKKLLEELGEMIIIQQKRIYDLLEIPENEYSDLLLKAIRMLQIFGITLIDFDIYQKEFIEWLIKRLAKIQKTLTNKELNDMRRLYNLYISEYNKQPAKLNDLKILIKEYDLQGYGNKAAGS